MWINRCLGCMAPSQCATRVEIVKHASVTNKTPCFQPCGRGRSYRASCVRCGLLIQAGWKRDKLLEVIALPCSRGSHFLALGVHPSHQPYVDGHRASSPSTSLSDVVQVAGGEVVTWHCQVLNVKKLENRDRYSNELKKIPACFHEIWKSVAQANPIEGAVAKNLRQHLLNWVLCRVE